MSRPINQMPLLSGSDSPAATGSSDKLVLETIFTYVLREKTLPGALADVLTTLGVGFTATIGSLNYLEISGEYMERDDAWVIPWLKKPIHGQVALLVSSASILSVIAVEQFKRELDDRIPEPMKAILAHPEGKTQHQIHQALSWLVSALCSVILTATFIKFSEYSDAATYLLAFFILLAKTVLHLLPVRLMAEEGLPYSLPIEVLKLLVIKPIALAIEKTCGFGNQTEAQLEVIKMTSEASALLAKLDARLTNPFTGSVSARLHAKALAELASGTQEKPTVAIIENILNKQESETPLGLLLKNIEPAGQAPFVFHPLAYNVAWAGSAVVINSALIGYYAVAESVMRGWMGDQTAAILATIPSSWAFACIITFFTRAWSHEDLHTLRALFRGEFQAPAMAKLYPKTFMLLAAAQTYCLLNSHVAAEEAWVTQFSKDAHDTDAWHTFYTAQQVNILVCLVYTSARVIDTVMKFGLSKFARNTGDASMRAVFDFATLSQTLSTLLGKVLPEQLRLVFDTVDDTQWETLFGEPKAQSRAHANTLLAIDTGAETIAKKLGRSLQTGGFIAELGTRSSPSTTRSSQPIEEPDLAYQETERGKCTIS